MRPASHLIASSAEKTPAKTVLISCYAAMQDKEEAMTFFGREEGNADQSQG